MMVAMGEAEMRPSTASCLGGKCVARAANGAACCSRKNNPVAALSEMMDARLIGRWTFPSERLAVAAASDSAKRVC